MAIPNTILAMNIVERVGGGEQGTEDELNNEFGTEFQNSKLLKLQIQKDNGVIDVDAEDEIEYANEAIEINTFNNIHSCNSFTNNSENNLFLLSTSTRSTEVPCYELVSNNTSSNNNLLEDGGEKRAEEAEEQDEGDEDVDNDIPVFLLERQGGSVDDDELIKERNAQDNYFVDQRMDDCPEGAEPGKNVEISTVGKKRRKRLSDDSQEDAMNHKTFKEKAIELMEKAKGENSHLVQRQLTSDDWLYIHRIIRKSKGLKSKFMIKNLNPILFEREHVTGWKCKYCTEMVSAPRKSYVNHLEECHEMKGGGGDELKDPFYPCDICGEYIRESKYVVHWVPHFLDVDCPICKKKFALNCHMKYHYKVVHEESEQTCFQCGKLLKNESAMRRHLRLFHTNRTNWKSCDICGKCVKSRCLEAHKLTHSIERRYKCDTCKKGFKTPSTLYQHQKVHATDSVAQKYLCFYCGKRFKHHTSWNLHVVRIHEGEYEHECQVCHKRFHKLFELKKHSIKHSECRPYGCTVCQKQFKTKTHLKEHATVHSTDKKNVCPICGKQIRMKANLYKHLKVHRNRGEFVPPLNSSSFETTLPQSTSSSSSSSPTSISSSSSLSSLSITPPAPSSSSHSPPSSKNTISIKDSFSAINDIESNKNIIYLSTGAQPILESNSNNFMNLTTTTTTATATTTNNDDNNGINNSITFPIMSKDGHQSLAFVPFPLENLSMADLTTGGNSTVKLLAAQDTDGKTILCHNNDLNYSEFNSHQTTMTLLSTNKVDEEVEEGEKGAGTIIVSAIEPGPPAPLIDNHNTQHQLIVLDSNNTILSVHDELNLGKHLAEFDSLIVTSDGTILGQKSGIGDFPSMITAESKEIATNEQHSHGVTTLNIENSSDDVNLNGTVSLPTAIINSANQNIIDANSTATLKTFTNNIISLISTGQEHGAFCIDAASFPLLMINHHNNFGGSSGSHDCSNNNVTNLAQTQSE